LFYLLTKLLSFCRPARLFRWLILAVGGTVLWLTINYSKLQEYYTAHENRNNMLDSVNKLQKQRNKLVREWAALQAGGFPLEKAIRERFMMVHPGENILFIDPPETKDAARKKPDPAKTGVMPEKGVAKPDQASGAAEVEKSETKAEPQTSQTTDEPRTSQIADETRVRKKPASAKFSARKSLHKKRNAKKRPAKAAEPQPY
jgi:cell division protein FtsB